MGKDSLKQELSTRTTAQYHTFGLAKTPSALCSCDAPGVDAFCVPAIVGAISELSLMLDGQQFPHNFRPAFFVLKIAKRRFFFSVPSNGHVLQRVAIVVLVNAGGHP